MKDKIMKGTMLASVAKNVLLMLTQTDVKIAHILQFSPTLAVKCDIYNLELTLYVVFLIEGLNGPRNFRENVCFIKLFQDF